MRIESYIMPIYRQKITFAIGKDLEKIAKKLNIHESGCDYNSYNAMSVRVKHKNGGRGFYILLFDDGKSLDLSSLAHEVTHLCINICDTLGIKIEAWNDEALAYMVEYIFRKLCKFLKIQTKVKI